MGQNAITVVHPPFMPMELIRLVANLSKLTVADVTGERRYKECVRARAVIAVIMREKGLGYAAIARWLKNDRSTVRHACTAFKYNYCDDKVACDILKVARKQFIGEGA